MKSNHAINASIERHVEFSDAPATMQKNKKSNFVSTVDFRKVMIKHLGQFNNFDQQDAHELFSTLLDKMSLEMKREPKGFVKPPAEDESDLLTLAKAHWD